MAATIAPERTTGPVPTDESIPVPADVERSIKPGREAMKRDASKRRLCMKFEKGETYWYLNEQSVLSFQETVTRVGGGGKPPHRIRNKYNFIRPIVEDKVSTATQQIPSYDITPSTTDPEDYSAAKLSEKVALYGYDKWRIRKVSLKVVKLAVAGGGDGFAFPYFDPNVGPYVQVQGDDGEPRWQGQGELKVKVLSGNEVYWEDGCDFDESRWWCIEQARPIAEVRDLPTLYPGVVLAPDASTSDIPTDVKAGANMVMVTDYFERPCPKRPKGRRLTIANRRVICPPEAYPLRDSKGNVLDEPLIHRLSYTIDPDSDRDLGLVWQLIDAQRTVQDCWNKLLEWKNRTLNPQMLAPEGSLTDTPDDVPGAVKYYRPVGGQIPQWETPPPTPQALFQMLSAMKADMQMMASYEDLTATAEVAASTVSQVLQAAQARNQSFLGDLAEWHSRLMRHLLLLTSVYYTEPRLLTIKGRFGPEVIPDFKGANLMDQIDVTVLPQSLAFRTTAQITTQVLAFADRGWITGQQAMATINGGNADSLVQSFELAIARADRVIQKIRDGSVMDMPPRTDTVTATPENPSGQQQTPSFMPSPQDNLAVWKSRFGDWMITQEFEVLPPPMQEVANLIWTGIGHLQQEQEQAAMLAQNAQAQALGMQNAARPTTAAQSPSPSSPDSPPPAPPGQTPLPSA